MCGRILSREGTPYQYWSDKRSSYLSPSVENCQKRAIRMAGDFEGNPFADPDGINPFAVRLEHERKREAATVGGGSMYPEAC